MTHDLMNQLLESLGTQLARVVVTELIDSTFYAELHLRSGAQERVLSCRPSDAIALALRTRSPLYVADDLMDAEGLLIEPDDDEDDAEETGNPDEIVGEFREFLDRVRPEDFSG
jgi:bifunctional DNase/RNase